MRSANRLFSLSPGVVPVISIDLHLGLGDRLPLLCISTRHSCPTLSIMKTSIAFKTGFSIALKGSLTRSSFWTIVIQLSV